jgi:hypothetical protein
MISSLEWFVFSRTPWLALVAVLATVGSSGLARAGCQAPHVKFCENCDTPVTLKVDENSPCRLSIKARMGIKAARVVKPSGHGVAGIEQSTRPTDEKAATLTHILYVPTKDYLGPDEFSVFVNFVRCQSSGAGNCFSYETNVVYHVNVVGKM